MHSLLRKIDCKCGILPHAQVIYVCDTSCWREDILEGYEAPICNHVLYVRTARPDVCACETGWWWRLLSRFVC